MSSKKLINSASTVVQDAIEGLLMSNSNLKRLGNLNIVVRKDILTYREKHVTIISGGGSGHEPAHAGFVGEGMLSAAVLGNVFASPSVSAILAALRICGGPPGVLLIIKNYTGDRLNFGMASELAKQEGIKCEICIVEDDCALPQGKGITGGRGVAGTVFVHKIAGAIASTQANLETVVKRARATAMSIGTMGVALNVCAVPGAPVSTRLADPNIYEVGMGIHGEPGREQRQLPAENAGKEAANIMVDSILSRQPIAASSKVAIMINNLGALPVIELYIVARQVIVRLKQRGIAASRVYVGSFMTALDMSGVSVSILDLQQTRASEAWGFRLTEVSDMALDDCLDYPTEAQGWIMSANLDDYDEFPLEYDEAAFSKKIKGGNPCHYAVAMAKAISQALIIIEPKLTEYDSICGDGDCGLVIKAGATRILADYAGADTAEDAALFCDNVATSISSSMGGTSGVLLEICFRAMATSLSKPSGGLNNWPKAMRAGVDAIMLYGGAQPGMRTLLDALVPAVAVLEANGSISDAASAALQGVENTKTMNSLAGRSNYVNNERMNGIPDPGAFAVGEAFKTAAFKIKIQGFNKKDSSPIVPPRKI